MMRAASLSEISSVLDATLVAGNSDAQSVVFSEVCTDTRVLQPGQLYVALRGENFDGNSFLAQAAEKGACGAIARKPAEAAMPLLLIEDPQAALGDLALWNRRLSAARVVAITGSQGKTTVKEMVGSILRVRNQVLVTAGNLNNQIGVPLTLLELEASHSHAVLELGASAAGDIAYTVALTQPEAVLINNAAAAHLEGFGSLEGVVAAKGEIIDGASADGCVVLNADDPAFQSWRERAGSRRMVSFSARGEGSGADYYAVDISMQQGAGSHFRMHCPAGDCDIQLPLPGRHNVANALAAAALAMVAGAQLSDVQAGLAALTPVAGRLRPVKGCNGAQLIDDSYNANPGSFRAAIDVLAACQGRRVLVAGDMAELGESAEDSHREVGSYAHECGIDELWTVGRASRLAAEAYGAGARHFTSHEELINHARAQLTRDTTVLIKGSRSSQMDQVVRQLTEGGGA